MSATKTNRRKVLIVDADETEAEQIKSAIPCFDVQAVDTIRDALSVLNREAQGLSCVILDPNLPNGKGVSMVKRMAKLFPHIPLLIVLGVAEAPPAEYAREGVDHVLSAPIDPSSFRSALIDCISRAEAHQMYLPLKEEVDRLKAAVSANTEAIREATAVINTVSAR